MGRKPILNRAHAPARNRDRSTTGHISIPEHLKSTPVNPAAEKWQLRLLIEHANIRTLGDLDGKRLSDFEHYSGCAGATVWGLRCLIFRALHPGLEPDRTTWPVPIGDWDMERLIEVAPAVRGLSLKCLPLHFRLERLFENLQIETLGQLHGLSRRKLLQTSSCGPIVLAEVLAFVPRAEAGEFALYEQGLAWPEARFKVAPAAEDLRPNYLPLSVRLEEVLRSLGIATLAQLHGLPMRNVQRIPNCGPGTLAELKQLLGRAGAGEFRFTQQELASKTPIDLLLCLDDLISRLPEQDRVCLTLRFDGSGDAPQSLRQIGQQYGVTRSAVAVRAARALDWMRRQGSLKLLSLFKCVDDCAANRASLNPALVSTWQDPARPFRHSPSFYVRLIAKLRSE